MLQKMFISGISPQEVLDSVSDAFCILTPKYELVYFNKEAARILKFDKDDIGKNIFTLFPEAEKALFTTKLEHVKQSNKTSSFEYFHEPHGEWYSIKLTPSENSICVFFHSITDLKKNQVVLEKNEEVLRLAMESTSDGIWQWDLNENIVIWSPRNYTMLGYEADEFNVSYDVWKSLVHPDDIEQSVKEIEKQVSSENNFSIEFRLKCKDGSWKWILGRGKCVKKDEAGNPLRLIGTHMDLTERKQAEKDRELRLKMLDSANDLFFVHDLKGNIVYLNRKACELYDLKQREIYDKKIFDFADEQNKGFIRERIKKVQNQRQITFETVHVTKDNRKIPLEINSQIIENEGESLIISCCRDISDWYRTRDVLEEARNDAEKANRAKSEFMANISHEIRTPMNGIIGMSELLDECETREERKEYIEVIKSSGETLLHIINDILDLAKVESGKIDFAKRQFDLHKCINDVVRSVEHSAKSRNIELKLLGLKGVPRFFVGDDSRLQQILLNLIGNALKFTEEGSITINVNSGISHTETGNRLILFSVKDTGIGIPEEKQDLIFDPFEQVDASSTRSRGGTGLGLSICKKLIEALGGRIWFKSTPGKGSQFFFNLSLEPAEPAEPDENDIFEENSNEKRKFSILTAEDNEVSQLLITKLLSKFNCDFDVVSNGREALEKFNQKEYDMVLMDVQMPVMDGLEATGRMKSIDGKNVPIIALTAHAMQGDMQRCLEAGMDDYLSKPVKKNDLEKMIYKYRKRRKNLEINS